MSQKRRIGIVANSAFNIYNFRLGLIKKLKQEGHWVIAIAPADAYTPLLKEEDIDVIEIKHLSRKGTNPLHDLRLCNELRKIYHQQKLNIVLQYTIKPNIYGTIAAKLAGVKSICTVTGLGYTFLNKNIASTIAHWLYKLSFAFANKVLFQNQDDEHVFLAHHLVAKQKTMIVPGSGINTQKFNPAFCTTIQSNNKVRFLMIARLLKDKGVYEYAAAAKRISATNKKTEFHLLGDIDNNNPTAIKKEELEEWIENGSIIYHGYTKDTRPFICNADAVVLPSYREGMPRVILEGLAMGKPCITSNAPGCKDAVEDGKSGLICSVANTEALVESINKFLMLDKEQIAQMSTNARKRAENTFSEEIVFQTYLQILTKI